MGALEGTELPDALREAHRIVDQQLSYIRPLAEQARSETERISALIRHIDRQLDELVMQQRTAVQNRVPAAQDLGQRVGELRQVDPLRAGDRLVRAHHGKGHRVHLFAGLRGGDAGRDVR